MLFEIIRKTHTNGYSSDIVNKSKRYLYDVIENQKVKQLVLSKKFAKALWGDRWRDNVLTFSALSEQEILNRLKQHL